MYVNIIYIICIYHIKFYVQRIMKSCISWRWSGSDWVVLRARQYCVLTIQSNLHIPTASKQMRRMEGGWSPMHCPPPLHNLPYPVPKSPVFRLLPILKWKYLIQWHYTGLKSASKLSYTGIIWERCTYYKVIFGPLKSNARKNE